MPMQMPRNGTPLVAVSPGDRVEPGAFERLHAPAERADAGQHDAGGVADDRLVGGEPGVRTDVFERLLRRTQVADAVVEDGDQRAGTSSQGRPSSTARPRPRRARRRADDRATPLNVASMTWWVFSPARLRTCSVIAGGGGERLPEVPRHLRVERRVAERQHLAERHVPHDEGPARQVERDLDERLVEREQAAGEAAHAGLVAERLARTSRPA